MVIVPRQTRIRRFLLGCCVTSLVAAAPVPGQVDDDANRPSVTAVRHWSMGDVTRIVVESTGEFRFKSDRIHNPERLFFDLLGTKPQLSGAGRGVSVIPVGDRFLRQIRVAETQPGVTRIVLDLVSNLEFSTSQLANPARLIIELHATLDAHLRDDSRVKDDDRFRPLEPVRAAVPEPRSPPLPEQRTPRSARLDFSALILRRQAAWRALRPTIPDPPAQFDPWRGFDYWVGIRPDPLIAGLAALKTPLQPPPARRGLARSMPEITAPSPRESAPVSIPVKPVPSPSSAYSPLPGEAGLPAKRTPSGDTMTRILGLKLGRVVIDPGHGGYDTGTSGPDGLREKDVVLDVAKRLGLLLQDRLGSDVVFTRDSDTFVPLSRRTSIANERKADLFLSIHANSSPVSSVAGVETYYLNFSTSKSSIETAMRENAGADRGVGELQDLVKKIAQKDKADESHEFASRVQASLSGLSPKSMRAARDRGVKRAPFVVLIGASMPSILAEVGFISNPQDETQMGRPEYRQRIAEALYKGVASYANSLSHFQVARHAGATAVSGPEF